MASKQEQVLQTLAVDTPFLHLMDQFYVTLFFVSYEISNSRDELNVKAKKKEHTTSSRMLTGVGNEGDSSTVRFPIGLWERQAGFQKIMQADDNDTRCKPRYAGPAHICSAAAVAWRMMELGWFLDHA
jgi:hypothetical protein